MFSGYVSLKGIGLCLNPLNRSVSLPLPSGFGILVFMEKSPRKEKLFHVVPKWNLVISCMPVPERVRSLRPPALRLQLFERLKNHYYVVIIQPFLNIILLSFLLFHVLHTKHSEAPIGEL